MKALPREERFSWPSFVVLSVPSRGHSTCCESSIHCRLRPMSRVSGYVVLDVMCDVRNDAPIGVCVNLKSCLGMHRNARCKVSHPIIFPDIMDPLVTVTSSASARAFRYTAARCGLRGERLPRSWLITCTPFPMTCNGRSSLHFACRSP